MIKELTFAGLILIGSVGGCLKGCNNWQVSEGERTGMVNKVSTKGYFWKTYEGQMALEGLTSGGSSTSANIWDFSVDEQTRHNENKDEIFRRLQSSMDNGRKVKVKYLEMAYTWPWRSGSNYLIQNVSYLDATNPNVTNPQPREGAVTSQKLEKTTNEEFKGTGQREVTIDGRNYLLRHDPNGKLKVMELKEVQ
jgi:hypothetical protein